MWKIVASILLVPLSYFLIWSESTNESDGMTGRQAGLGSEFILSPKILRHEEGNSSNKKLVPVCNQTSFNPFVLERLTSCSEITDNIGLDSRRAEELEIIASQAAEVNSNALLLRKGDTHGAQWLLRFIVECGEAGNIESLTPGSSCGNAFLEKKDAVALLEKSSLDNDANAQFALSGWLSMQDRLASVNDYAAGGERFEGPNPSRSQQLLMQAAKNGSKEAADSLAAFEKLTVKLTDVAGVIPGRQ